MGAISKIKLPDNTVNDIHDSRLSLTSPSNGQILKYNSTSQKLENGELPVLICNFTSSNGTYTCDKTVQQIFDAYTNKYVVIAILSTGTGLRQGFYLSSAININGLYDIVFSRTTNSKNANTNRNTISVATLYYSVLTQNTWVLQNVTTDELPSFSGNSGKVLSTDGTKLEWSERSVFVCTFTGTNTITCNKSVAEIYAAYQENKTIIGLLSTSYFYLSYVSSTWAVFFNLKSSDGVTATKIISTDGGTTWTWSDYTLQQQLIGSGTGQNIKTINNESILGSGNINIIGGDGISNYDFTHVANTTVSTSTKTITFAANQRGSQMISVSADIGITFDVRNLSDNYLWIKNTGSAEIDVTISSVVNDQTTVSNVYVPADGISVPAGGLCEIGIVRNADGAFITSRSDLEL